ncbi:hypothetical protein Cantr_00084 [Candida viswanathii]|uniref:Uncharacterized protein n=1 Tax=Candida viswanathii TaxID=5486 RepID=A0A367YFU9_9ASCO|nr:hypothetical protein Cantr_00084 [Candida viswanathii]
MKVSILLLTIILVASAAIIPRSTNEDNTVSIASNNKEYELKENVNFIKVSGSTNIQELKDAYPNGDIVNDLNNPRKQIFIFNVDNLLTRLTKKDTVVY